MPRAINGRLFASGYQSVHNAFNLAVTKARAAQPDSTTFLKGLRFHDLRHEAVTRLFEKGLNPIEVGMVSGHKTLSMLQRYTHLRSEELVSKLA
jgi:integrase